MSWRHFLVLACAMALCHCQQSNENSQITAGTAAITYDASLVGEPIQAMIGREQNTIQEMVVSQAEPAKIAASWRKLGMIFQAYLLRESALKAYVAAVMLEPQNWVHHYLLGTIYLDMVAPEDAMAAFEKSLAQHPNHDLTLFQLADLSRNQGHLEAAVAYYRKATAANDQLAVAWLGLSQTELELGQIKAALTDVNRALMLQPEAKPAYYQLAQVYREMNDEDRAEQALIRYGQTKRGMVHHDPILQQVRAYANLGRQRMAQGDRALGAGQIGLALDAYRQAVSFSPHDFAAMAKLGNAHLRNSDPESAREAYARALTINPGNALLLYNIGSAYMEAGLFVQAGSHFEKALGLESKLVEARMRLADSFRLRGQWDAASDAYQAALVDAPGFGSARLGQAVCLLATNRRIEASQLLRTAWQESDQNPVIGRVLARVLASSPEADARDGKMALAVLKILEIKAPGPYLIETRAMALAEIGEYEAAIKALGPARANAIKRGDNLRLSQLQNQLATYRNRQPWHKPYDQNHALFRQLTY